jgi:hypothetical protein
MSAVASAKCPILPIDIVLASFSKSFVFPQLINKLYIDAYIGITEATIRSFAPRGFRGYFQVATSKAAALYPKSIYFEKPDIQTAPMDNGSHSSNEIIQ